MINWRYASNPKGGRSGYWAKGDGNQTTSSFTDEHWMYKLWLHQFGHMLGAGHSPSKFYATKDGKCHYMYGDLMDASLSVKPGSNEFSVDSIRQICKCLRMRKGGGSCIPESGDPIAPVSGDPIAATEKTWGDLGIAEDSVDIDKNSSSANDVNCTGTVVGSVDKCIDYDKVACISCKTTDGNRVCYISYNDDGTAKRVEVIEQTYGKSGVSDACSDFDGCLRAQMSDDKWTCSNAYVYIYKLCSDKMVSDVCCPAACGTCKVKIVLQDKKEELGVGPSYFLIPATTPGPQIKVDTKAKAEAEAEAETETEDAEKEVENDAKKEETGP